MTIEARFLAEKPEDIKFTMKITMTAKEWCSLRDDLNAGNWTAQEFRSLVTDLLAQARKTFYPETLPTGEAGNG